MGKVKIYDMAKKLNLTSKEILERAEMLKIEAKSHLSNIDEADAQRIEESFKTGDKKPSAKKEEKTSKTQTDTPVIIRREVIINNEEEAKKKEQQKKKEERKQQSVGFVERKQNDYNIVYRNRPSKPMTVSELFGIGKKEEEKKENVEKVEQLEVKKVL